jgi:hypothetical protein
MNDNTNISLAPRGEGVRRTGEGPLGFFFRFFTFLKRIRHCAGFGVQSPTDYAFVREVIYERWPYALYAELEAQFYGTDKFLLKLSQLLLRVSNYAQASRIGIIGSLPPVMEAHLKAGCRKSEIMTVKGQKSKDKGRGEGTLDFSPSSLDIFPLLIATDLNDQWREYISQEHIISYDLYYLGIAFYDEKRYTEGHVINFY